MHKGRLEAFSDAVIAIILTIMVLELRPPAGHSIADLAPLFPVFLSYLLSFAYLAIYWNNHHHMLQSVTKVTGAVLWANMHLLLCLSLVPFATAWLGESGMSSVPVAAYGAVLLLCAISYTILVRVLVNSEGANSRFAMSIGDDAKGKVSLFLYVAALGFAFLLPPVSCALYVVVALIWFVPDRRFERSTTDHETGTQPGRH